METRAQASGMGQIAAGHFGLSLLEITITSGQHLKAVHVYNHVLNDKKRIAPVVIFTHFVGLITITFAAKKEIMKPALFFMVGLFAFNATAQNIKRETVSFQYESKPSTPFTEDVTTYDVFIVQSFKEGYEETIAQWERDCEAVQSQ